MSNHGKKTVFVSDLHLDDGR
jgi:UDP-2,3-diacylglucosamine pyrophosphatase LpxH